MTKRRDFVALPLKWLSSTSFHGLTKTELLLLLSIWAESTDGIVPRSGKAAQIKLRICHRPKQIAQMLLKLRDKGFLEDRDSSTYLLKDWERFVGKYNKNAHKPSPGWVNKKQRNRKISKASAETSRAPAPPYYRKGDKEGEQGADSGVSPDSPSVYPASVLQLMKQYTGDDRDD